MQANNHGLVNRISIQLLYIREADESRNACTDTNPLTVRRYQDEDRNLAENEGN